MQKYKMRLCDRAAVLGMKVELEHLRNVFKDHNAVDFNNGTSGAFAYGYALATKNHIEWLEGFIKSYEDMFSA